MLCRIARSLVIPVAFALSASSLAAQEPTWIGEIGSLRTLRVHTDRGSVYKAAFIGVDGDSIVLADGPVGARFIAIRSIVRMQTLDSVRYDHWRGMGAGFLKAGAIGAVLGAVTWSPCEGFGCMMHPPDRGAAAGVTGLLFGAVGGVIGLIGGSRIESWHDLALRPATGDDPARGARLSVRPDRGGFRVGLSMAMR
jgi:hypothetical protein